MKKVICGLVALAVINFVSVFDSIEALAFEVPYELLVTKIDGSEGRYVGVLRVADTGDTTKGRYNKGGNEYKSKKKAGVKKHSEAKKDAKKDESHALPDICKGSNPPSWCL